jgi:hypothetical protein
MKGVVSTASELIPALAAAAIIFSVAAFVTWQLLDVGKRGRPFLLPVLKATAVLSLLRIGAFLSLLYIDLHPQPIVAFMAIRVSIYPEGALLSRLLPNSGWEAGRAAVIYIVALVIGSLLLITAIAGLVAGLNRLTRK